MEPLLPYHERVIRAEISRLKAEEKKAGLGLGAEPQTVSKNDIEKLSQHFAGLLTGRVTPK